MNQFQMFLLQLPPYIFLHVYLYFSLDNQVQYQYIRLVYTYLPYSAIHAFPMPSLSLNQVLFQPGGHTLHVPHMGGS